MKRQGVQCHSTVAPCTRPLRDELMAVKDDVLAMEIAGKVNVAVERM